MRRYNWVWWVVGVLAAIILFWFLITQVLDVNIRGI